MARDSMVPNAEGRELFLGLVAPLGVDLDDALEVLKASLNGVGYKTHEIRMSRLLGGVPALTERLPAQDAPEDERIEGYMDAADRLRGLVGLGQHSGEPRYGQTARLANGRGDVGKTGAEYGCYLQFAQTSGRGACA